MIKKEVVVPVVERKEFVKKLNKLNEKAVKYGIEPMKWEMGEEWIEKCESEAIDDDGSKVKDCILKHQRTVNTFTIIYDPIKIGDFRVVGVSEQHPTAGLLVYGEEVHEWYNEISSTRCDHCNRNHQRRIHIILKDNRSEEYKVVGKSCVKEYTGMEPQNFFKWMHEIESLETSRAGWVAALNTEELFKVCVEIISKEGFKSVANHGWDHSTGAAVLTAMGRR